MPRSIRAATHIASFAVVAACQTRTIGAQESGPATQVFSRFAERVSKVQVVETGSAARATIGSAFFVTDQGHLVTNYHVVSQLILAPERYRAELVDGATTRPVAILAMDVVHDLVVLGSAARPRSHFTIGPTAVSQGDRLYALGHPEDLGLSIVEGTYNGLLPHTLHPRIHFTGSLNHGMSGGPTITETGQVIGVNVATAGNQLSFLIPVQRAAQLLDKALAVGNSQPPTLDEIGRQLRAYQDEYLKDMFVQATKTVALGPYRLVTEPAPFFRCWADATRNADLPYEKVEHRCATDDFLFIAGEQSSGMVSVEHELISTRTLNAPRFFSLYTSVFGSDNTPYGDEEHVTSWRCGTRNVRNTSAAMRGVLCLRRYRKLGELYDGVLKVAVLGRRNTGLVSTLTLSGVTFDNIDKLSRRYLEHISWK
ncbi:MAG: S1 family peptidase [Gemmatimonadaceae bacterium]